MANKRLRQIQDTAIDLFRKQGFETTSVQDICDACHITKPTFYKYVNSKDELLRHFYDEATDELLACLEEPLKKDDYWNVIWICFTNTSNYSLNLGWKLLSQYLILNFHEHTVTSRYTSVGRQIATRAITMAQKTGQIRNQADPEVLFMSLKNMGLAYMLHWCITKEGFDYFSAFYESLEMILQPDYEVIQKHRED